MAERVTWHPVPHKLVARRPGDPVALYADTTRSKEVLGWTAHRGLEEVLASAWAWHSTHPDGYGD